MHSGDSITVLDLVEAEGEGEATGELLDGLEGLARPVNCWTLLLQQFCVQLQQDTAGVKHDTAGVKHNTAGVKHNTAGVKHNTAGVKYNSAGIKHDTAGAKHDSTGVREKDNTDGVKHDTVDSSFLIDCGLFLLLPFLTSNKSLIVQMSTWL